MLPVWERCQDCADGEDAVKKRGEKYLPKRDSHRKQPDGAARYDAYKARAMYYNATGRTVDGLSGMIFQKPPVVKTPTAVEKDMDDVTLSGVSAQMFALETTRQIVTKARYGALVEWSESAMRPYWVARRAEQITHWRVEYFGGDAILTRVVMREEVTEANPKDPFQDLCILQYRVLDLVADTPGGARRYTQTVWRKPKNTWQPVSEVVPMRRGEPLPFIPFTFISRSEIGDSSGR